MFQLADLTLKIFKRTRAFLHGYGDYEEIR